MLATIDAEATRLATILQNDLDALAHDRPISACALTAPRRRSTKTSALASAVAAHLFPDNITEPLRALIQYEKVITQLRAAFLAQEHAEKERIRKENRTNTWSGRIEAQGPWDEINDPISLEGVEALPTPVKISSEESLASFFGYLAQGGDFDGRGDRVVQLEPHSKEPYIEFEKGVLYKDSRMDLCKVAAGPQHIENLLTALRTNSFVRHFLFGNNLIGRRGAHAVADFIQDYPDKFETWYLASCCFDAASLKLFVDQIVKSSICHSIWLKRNALTSSAAGDVARMIILMKGLKTLDLDQTNLGDAGVAQLLEQLGEHVTSNDHPLSLETMYLNADGIGHKGCISMARYLGSPNCALNNLSVACNPIGDKGAYALAEGLATNTSLLRLCLKSCGLKTAGAIALFTALRNHPKLCVLDVSHAYTTKDLDARYNYIEDGVTESIIDMLTHLRTLRSFSLGITAMSRDCLDSIKPALRSSDLFFYMGTSIHISPNSTPAIVKPDGVHDHLLANVKAYYGKDMCYSQFLDGPMRLLTNGEHMGYIHSVYRSRDSRKVRRGEMVLQKKWDEGDNTLMEVQRMFD